MTNQTKTDTNTHTYVAISKLVNLSFLSSQRVQNRYPKVSRSIMREIKTELMIVPDKRLKQ